MSISVDCSEIIDQLNQQCGLECRQPTRQEYEFVISSLQQVNLQLQEAIMQLQQDKNELAHNNEILDSKCAQLSQDSQNSLELLRKEHLKVEEIAKLSTIISELEEKASDSEKTLEDVIKTNEGLSNQVSSMEHALKEKNTQINTLVEQHNNLVHKNNDNEETIASLIKYREHCQCKLRPEGRVMRGTALAPMSSDSLSSLNVPENIPSMAENTVYDKYSPSNVGKLKPESEVKREICQSLDVQQQKFDLQESQSHLPKTGIKHDGHPKRKKSSLSNKVGSVKCNHLDEEQEAMIGKILQTTSKASLYCKTTIGNWHCRSTDNLNMCLKCGVTFCPIHLYERHSKEHTIFMKMATETIWCHSCKCDPLSSDGVMSLHKSSKKLEKNKPAEQLYNHRGEFSRKSSDHYRNPRSRSLSQSSTETIVATPLQAPSHHSPIDHRLPITTTSSVYASTESYLSSTGTFADRQALTTVGSTTTLYRDKMSPSNVSSPGDVLTTEADYNSSNPPASKIPPVTAKHSAVSDSLPSLCEPTVTTVDPPATTSTVPRIGGKQTVTTGTKSSNKNTAGNLKSNILDSPIKQTTFKCMTSTNTTTAIVPVTSRLYSGTLYPLMSTPEVAHNNTSTKLTSLANEISTSTSRPSITSYSGYPSFDSRDSTKTRPSSSVGSSQPDRTSDAWAVRRRSGSLDNLYGFDPPPFKGLVNAGLTCFFNSAIQGLSRIDQFNELLTKLFKPGDHVQMDLKKLESSLQVTIPPGSHGEVSKHFSKTIADVRKPAVNRHDKYFDPSRLFSSIQAKYKNSFRPYRQGDAHEVMRCILDAIRMEEIEKVKRGIKLTYTGSEHGDVEALQNGEEKMLCKAALRSAHKVRTYIDQVIGGELLSVVVCEHCKHRAELIEPFLDVSLPIPDKRSAADSSYYTSHCDWMTSCTQNPTLEECFKEYTSEDTLDNDNKFICSKCSGTGDKIKLRRAMKQLKLLTLPQVFIIHLKRFSIDHIVTKNSIQVKYPAVIDVKEYCTQQSLSDNRQSTKYSLFAVVQHIGTLNFGHYTAYIKMDDTKKWYKADDSSVTEVDKNEALHQEAYLLFYQQM